MTRRLVHVLACGVLAGSLVACDGDSPTAPDSASSNTLGLADGGLFSRALGGIESLQGRCPTVSFVIGSIRVVTTRATLFQRFECRELTNGTVVDATGVRQPDGTLLAREVELVRRR